MEFKIIAPGADEIELANGNVTQNEGRKLTAALQYSATGYFGKMLFQHFSGDGFAIWFSNYFISQPATLKGLGDVSVLELHIQFINSFDIDWSGTGKHTLHPHQFNLSYTPHLENKTMFRGDALYQTFDVHYTKEYLQRFAPAFPLLEKFLQKVEHEIATDFTKVNYAISPKMICVIEDMLRCPFRTEVAGVYYHSKVMELLILALERMSETDSNERIAMTAKEEKQMMEAKEILVADFENIPSILQLARKVGTNDFKLKKGFKQMFGLSIFAYVQNIRLDKAKELLLETNYSITEIAYMTGYNHLRNFSSAFKKHFGYEPTTLRLNKRV